MFLMPALSAMSAFVRHVRFVRYRPADMWRTCNWGFLKFDVRPKKPDFPRVSGLGGHGGHGGHVICKKRVLVRLTPCFPLLGGQSGHVADIKKRVISFVRLMSAFVRLEGLFSLKLIHVTVVCIL